MPIRTQSRAPQPQNASMTPPAIHPAGQPVDRNHYQDVPARERGYRRTRWTRDVGPQPIGHEGKQEQPPRYETDPPAVHAGLRETGGGLPPFRPVATMQRLFAGSRDARVWPVRIGLIGS